MLCHKRKRHFKNPPRILYYMTKFRYTIQLTRDAEILLRRIERLASSRKPVDIERLKYKDKELRGFSRKQVQYHLRGSLYGLVGVVIESVEVGVQRATRDLVGLIGEARHIFGDKKYKRKVFLPMCRYETVVEILATGEDMGLF
jgi:hypothetical protein